jgi:hypothetical protein
MMNRIQFQQLKNKKIKIKTIFNNMKKEVL